MAFTGKSPFASGTVLPADVEDLSDIVSIVSPYETPLLDHLGDAIRPATSVYHEWLEDEPAPTPDLPTGQAGAKDRAASRASQSGNRRDVAEYLRLRRQAAATDGEADVNRTRKGNWTQVFSAAVRVNGADIAARKLSIADELDYQKQERLRELLRELESTVINGPSLGSDQGPLGIRRTMKGIMPLLTTNRFAPGEGQLLDATDLAEEQLNLGLRLIFEQSGGRADTIVVGGYQKRRINSFITSARSRDSDGVSYRDLVSVYESDFGLCRVILCRAVPADAVLLLDSNHISVLPLAGRSFHYKPSDESSGEVVGEYTLELRNENSHGIIRGLENA